MVQSLPKPLSLQGFLALPESQPAHEYIDGRVFPKPMPQGQPSTLQIELTETIMLW